VSEAQWAHKTQKVTSTVIEEVLWGHQLLQVHHSDLTKAEVASMEKHIQQKITNGTENNMILCTMKPHFVQSSRVQYYSSPMLLHPMLLLTMHHTAVILT
jgi:hypothetical protein